ncbi:type II inositol 3,4-bisphosphate 4-phosphatase [Eurytemora carolleeae]|uniref:type II inositol 3,4-bisphosphate 4-phosphatase n=1 Tax=Eurytemora carolleeae TaxID=1294199 RepID=UPI000C77A513|nr:type II inositol 3,4-bisphosphate 4-phosphatase [Eurytemora carolleeae]|eukprot:XP_023330385.1 type II inositol 3,4-bisphosphate 4-phosphatase-like [Eurytemora affinis]
MVVVGGSRMKFNRTEMGLLACQLGHRFDKEGVMFVRERQDGFFRRNEKTKKKSGSSLICIGPAGRVSLERWCRLRGNLLFYFKSRDQWSEPAGVIVLENFTIILDTAEDSCMYGFNLVWEGGQVQYLACHTQLDREAWQAALLSASHANMRKHLENLKKRLLAVSAEFDGQIHAHFNIPKIKLSVIDPEAPPVLECAYICDNLLCDAIGRTPSTRLVVYVRNLSTEPWCFYMNTEIVERTSNPMFMLTGLFRAADNIVDSTQVKICAQDTRERFSMVRTILGQAVTSIQELKQTERLRLRLDSPNPDGRGAGFVTLHSWVGEAEGGGSTESTPSHTNQGRTNNPATSIIGSQGQGYHRRTNSLPSSISYKIRNPRHPNLALLHSNISVRTYRFHSGLGGDISVQELMAEPKFSFSFPQQLLLRLGELKEPWHTNQMRWLENHLNLINVYSNAMEYIENSKGVTLKKSTDKSDTNLEFVPTNLNLQRVWVENTSLRKSGYYDIHTVGAFTAFALKSRSEGLIRRVRREVVDSMRFLMKLAKERNPEGMFRLVESMLKKTKVLCSISDTMLVEEAFSFLEKNRVSVRPEKDDFSDSVAEFMQRNRLKIDLQFRPSFGSLQTPNTEFISKELRTPDPDYFSPSLDPSRLVLVHISILQGTYLNFDISRYMSIEDKTRHYYTLCRNATPHETPSHTPRDTPKHGRKTEDEGEEEIIIPIEVAKSETVFSENDSALEDDQRTEDGQELTDEEVEDGEANDYDFDENVYHNDDKDDDDDDESTPEQDDESTPQLGSDTSKTQSPSSVGRTRISFQEVQEVQEVQEGQEGQVDHQGSDGKHDELKKEEEQKQKDEEEMRGEKGGKYDNGIVCDSEESSHYRSGDEPEPIDLTHLNIEASMMCLASKIRTICGKAHSPTLSSRTFRFRELDSLKKGTDKDSLRDKSLEPVPRDSSQGAFENKEKPFLETRTSKPSDSTQTGAGNSDTLEQNVQKGSELDPSLDPEQSLQSGGFKIPDVPKPSSEEIKDWAGEVRPSMRKLRQGMDSLLKSSRLVCSVLRLQQIKDAVSLTHEVKYRRDVCFSQALTSLVSGLMARIWCHPPDPSFLTLLTKLGPLVTFEGLLSLHGEDVTIINDMIVAVEDLRSVEFTLVLVERRSKSKLSNRKVGHVGGSNCSATCGGNGNCAGTHVPLITCGISSFPLPRVTGSRTSLKVLLPVPEWVYSQVPLQHINNMSFNIVPVFFNIGINQHATIAEKLGLNTAQEKNNTDNYRILADYLRRFKQLRLFNTTQDKDTRMSWKSREVHLDDLMTILKNEVSSHKSKNVDILSLVAQITQQLEGVEGVRRLNCEKNTGAPKYAFNSLQLTTFPKLYRPPPGTYGSTET